MGGRSQDCVALYRDIVPSKSVKNAFAESFIGRLRIEVLNGDAVPIAAVCARRSRLGVTTPRGPLAARLDKP